MNSTEIIDNSIEKAEDCDVEPMDIQYSDDPQHCNHKPVINLIQFICFETFDPNGKGLEVSEDIKQNIESCSQPISVPQKQINPILDSLNCDDSENLVHKHQDKSPAEPHLCDIIENKERFAQIMSESLQNSPNRPNKPGTYGTPHTPGTSYQSIIKFYTLKDCSKFIPHLSFKNNIRILFKLNKENKPDPVPFPAYQVSRDFWDNYHVKMPYSDKNMADIRHTFYSKYTTVWPNLCKSLQKSIDSFERFDHILKKYNKNYETIQFDVIEKYLKTSKNNILILNKIAKLALCLPQVVTQSVPLLKQNTEQTIYLSQKQIACLLANAFFCTFLRRSFNNNEYKNYPTINFNKYS